LRHNRLCQLIKAGSTKHDALAHVLTSYILLSFIVPQPGQKGRAKLQKICNFSHLYPRNVLFFALRRLDYLVCASQSLVDMVADILFANELADTGFLQRAVYAVAYARENDFAILLL
jgi:hypothetical protein